MIIVHTAVQMLNVVNKQSNVGWYPWGEGVPIYHWILNSSPIRIQSKIDLTSEYGAVDHYHFVSALCLFLFIRTYFIHIFIVIFVSHKHWVNFNVVNWQQ